MWREELRLLSNCDTVLRDHHLSFGSPKPVTGEVSAGVEETSCTGLETINFLSPVNRPDR